MGYRKADPVPDTLWPARDTRTRPLMPLRRGHMAMLVAAGFLDNLCLEAEGRRILVLTLPCCSPSPPMPTNGSMTT